MSESSAKSTMEDIDRLSIGMLCTALLSDIDLAGSAIEQGISDMAAMPLAEARTKVNEILELLNGAEPVDASQPRPTVVIHTNTPAGTCPWCNHPANTQGYCPECGYSIPESGGEDLRQCITCGNHFKADDATAECNACVFGEQEGNES